MKNTTLYILFVLYAKSTKIIERKNNKNLPSDKVFGSGDLVYSGTVVKNSLTELIYSVDLSTLEDGDEDGNE